MSLTQSIFEHAFGNPSSNLGKFSRAHSAGEHYITPYGMSNAHRQRNFEARIQAFEPLLKSCIAELELFLPQAEIKGAYDVGDEYSFYRDLSSILGMATSEVFVIDNYLDTELFDVYFGKLERRIAVRVMTDDVRGAISAVAQKYAIGRTFELRTSRDVHDRVIFVDDRCWVVGQSLKDAARKKPTYIVEHSSVTMKPIYEDIWSKATSVVKSK